MRRIPTTLTDLAIPIGSVQPHPRNEDIHEGDVGAISESLKANSQYRPIVVSKKTGNIVAGNHTWKAAVALGWEEIAATFVNASPEQELRILIADNRTAQLAVNHDEALSRLLTEIAESDGGLAGTGWDGDDLDALLADLTPPVSFTDPDAVPDVTVGESTPGDVWTVGPHTIVHGSAVDPTAYSHLNGLATLVWTDPPYGVNYGAKQRHLQKYAKAGRRTEDIADDTPEETDQLLTAVLPLIIGNTKPGTPFFMSGPGGPDGEAFYRHLNQTNILRQVLIWVKNNMVMGRQDYHYEHEPVFYGWTPGAAHRPPHDIGRSSLLKHDRPQQSKLHPTMKPVALIENCLDNFHKPGDTVLDPFAGSGTTGIAAHRLGIASYLIEQAAEYVDTTVRRIHEHTGHPVTRNGEPHDLSAAAERSNP